MLTVHEPRNTYITIRQRVLDDPISSTLYKSQLSLAVLVRWPIRSVDYCRVIAVVRFQACVHSLFGILFPGATGKAQQATDHE